MAVATESVDVSDVPDLLRLAEEVRDTGEPRVLRVGDEDVAILMPIPVKRRRRVRTRADYDASIGAAGGWKGIVDGGQLKEDLRAARGSDRPAVELDL